MSGPLARAAHMAVTVQCVNGVHLVWDAADAVLLRSQLRVVPQPSGFAKPVSTRVARKWTPEEIAAARARHAASGGRGKKKKRRGAQDTAAAVTPQQPQAAQLPTPATTTTTAQHGVRSNVEARAPALPGGPAPEGVAPGAGATDAAVTDAASLGASGSGPGGEGRGAGSGAGEGSGTEPRSRDTAAPSSAKRRRMSKAMPAAALPAASDVRRAEGSSGGGTADGAGGSGGAGAGGGAPGATGSSGLPTLPLPGVSMPCVIPSEAVALGLRCGWLDLKGPLHQPTTASSRTASAAASITLAPAGVPQEHVPLAARPRCHHCPPPSSRQLLLNAVYEDLWRKGYHVTSGIKFGGDFLAYAADPQECHASFIVIAMEAGQSLPPCAFVASSRVSVIARKHPVLASVTSDGTVQYVWFRWIPDPPPRVPKALRDARASRGPRRRRPKASAGTAEAEAARDGGDGVAA